MENLIKEPLAQIGYELLILRISAKKIEVIIERQDGQPMRIEDCVEANNIIEPILDAEHPQLSKYTLEVSSPGIDRPLVKLEDYQRFLGKKCRVSLLQPIKRPPAGDVCEQRIIEIDANTRGDVSCNNDSITDAATQTLSEIEPHRKSIKTLRGIIHCVHDNNIQIMLQDGTLIEIEFSNIKNANIIYEGVSGS